MSKFDLDVLHQTISDTQSNICQAVIVKEGKLIYADTWNGYSINDTVHIQGLKDEESCCREIISSNSVFNE